MIRGVSKPSPLVKLGEKMSNVEFSHDELQMLKSLLFKVRSKYPGIEDIHCDGDKIWGFSTTVVNGSMTVYSEENPSGEEHPIY